MASEHLSCDGDTIEGANGKQKIEEVIRLLMEEVEMAQKSYFQRMLQDKENVAFFVSVTVW
jgi:hypothetical protein